MQKKKYDIAFLPINPRLISLSSQISKAVEPSLSTTILKTSLIGEEQNGWNQIPTDILKNVSLTFLPEIYYPTTSNFFTYSYRVIRSRNQMAKSFEPNFKCLLVFMDDFAEAEILIPLVKAKKIPVIFLQDGLFADEIQYNVSVYGFAKFLRARFLSKYFTKNKLADNSDFIFTWSDAGFYDYLHRINIPVSKIKVLGYPYVPQNTLIYEPKDSLNILIVHSPLEPRFASKKWENNLWPELLKLFDNLQHSLTIKPHPRVGFLEFNKLITETQSQGIGKKLYLADRNISAENLYDDNDIVITFFSAAAFDALFRGIPVIFMKSEYNNVRLLEELVLKNDIILIDNINEIPAILTRINSDSDYRQDIIQRGYQVAVKLAGKLNAFNKNFATEIHNILNLNDKT